MRDEARLLDLADRVVGELLHAATRPETDLTSAERRALVALALGVDLDVSRRLGIPASTVEIVAAARAGGLMLERLT